MIQLTTSIEQLLQHINDNHSKLVIIEGIQLTTILDELNQFIDFSKRSDEELKYSYALDRIARLLIHPNLTLVVANLFRPILVELMARLLTLNLDSEPFKKIELTSLLFSKVLVTAPQILPLLIEFLNSTPSILDRYLQLTIIDINEKLSDDTFKSGLIESLTILLQLTISFSNVSKYWNLSLLYNLLSVEEIQITTLAFKCIQLTFNLSETNAKSLVSEEIYFNSQVLVLNLLDQHERNRKITFVSEQAWDLTQLTNHLSPKVVQIGNTLLLKSSSIQTQPSKLVYTSTTVKKLQEIAQALSMASPILLEGETGVGKTALVEEVARSVSKPELVKIHLGDQTDSKALLGTYVTTSTPGQFKWEMGVLTKAVKCGYWVLIEDIDLAPQEVISVIVPLLENRTLFIPSRGERLTAADGFQLFATRRIAGSSTKISMNDSHIAGSSFWTKVTVNPLSLLELEHVLAQRFPKLQNIANYLTDVYQTVKHVYDHPDQIQVPASRIGRPITTRDLIKWATRLSQMGITSHTTVALPLENQAKQEFFSEAVDSFCGMLPDYEVWIKVLQVLGDAIGLHSQLVQHYISTYVPTLLSDNDAKLKVGRVLLHPGPKSEDLQLLKTTKPMPFALTKHALRLLERLAACVHLIEPVLLVGETGTGKTTIIQHLARLMNQKLVAVNLSQQSDSSDLLGGFKPVDTKALVMPLFETFEELFKATFPSSANTKFLEAADKLFNKKKWVKLLQLFKNAILEVEKLKGYDSNTSSQKSPKVKRKIPIEIFESWDRFKADLTSFEAQLDKIDNQLVFNFIEGSLVKAVRKGHWVLLDEINLASTETLECLSGLLQDGKGSILLTEKGDTEMVKRHPNFRIFACMNPATDVGKKDLPPGLRNRFTEFYVQSPDIHLDDLVSIVKGYLSGYTFSDEGSVMDVVDFYKKAKQLQHNRQIADGANQIPHYSIRTLSRSLTYAVQIVKTYGLRRSLYEGFSMAFTTQLNKIGGTILDQAAVQHILKTVKNVPRLLAQTPDRPPNTDFDDYVNYGSFWLPKGPEPIDNALTDSYVITSSVQTNLSNLARVIVSGKYPVLIQGPTSSGKTSMVEYLANCTGHHFVRINNHEHTDLQEYVGSYVSRDGKLVFQEGALVEALRKGYWIVLDELNLAPSDVLEALNRLLDDNRELLIAETQEVVKPHPHFMLFATQNPAGLYGGRKALSRAFRNRFLELHFDDIPEDELETILSQRCIIAPSYCKKLIQVYKTLQQRRQSTRVFESKEGFITLRDLFRWANRQAVGYEQLAQHGYMILAERVRKEEEKLIVQQVLEEVMKVKLNLEKLYSCEDLDEFKAFNGSKFEDGSIAWTKAMKRLYYLVANCIRFNEPVLLVGETGCGKTTVVQMLATALNQKLHILNCHQNTETSDLLGGQRPVRNKPGEKAKLVAEFKLLYETMYPTGDIPHFETFESMIVHFKSLIKLADSNLNQLLKNNVITEHHISELLSRLNQLDGLFEWHDGPLVESMKNGDLFLLDEISLAEDSVLERLNSVLEPKRLLVLAEKGSVQVEALIANPQFQFLATMNPGGDFGKKELSPALRNRFTEIWVPPVTDQFDLLNIIHQKLSQLETSVAEILSKSMLGFLNWYEGIVSTSKATSSQVYSLRDILSWANFILTSAPKVGPELAFVHGGCLVFLDTLGANSSLSTLVNNPKLVSELRLKCLKQLTSLVNITDFDMMDFYPVESTNLEAILNYVQLQLINTDTQFGITPFVINKHDGPIKNKLFALNAPTTFNNLRRTLRALQISKPVMLEGSPGVGKTSLIQALADLSGNRLVRINLSEQTDLMDLFGTDLPVEGGQSGEFAWRDAPFLQAMKMGWWVLLDEVNLANQTVLEGLNSCLDHRGSIYIPELNRSFDKQASFRVFAAQNPIQQGGGRKGLPKSFLNRFTQVYVEPLLNQDLYLICRQSFPDMSFDLVKRMVDFNYQLYDLTMVQFKFARSGSPWEFNLRDVFRWMELIQSRSDNNVNNLTTDPISFLDMAYLQRMRNSEDREQVLQLYRFTFELPTALPSVRHLDYFIDNATVRVGQSTLPRKNEGEVVANKPLQLLHSQLSSVESVMKCVEMNWMPILIGNQGTGKTSIVRWLAQTTGNKLVEFAMNAGVDTMELLGGFEQVESARYRQDLVNCIEQVITTTTLKLMLMNNSGESKCTILAKLNDLKFKVNKLDWNSASLDTIQLTIAKVKHVLNGVGSTLNEKEQDILLAVSELDTLWQNLITIEASSTSGKFEWIEGALVQAMQLGYWFLIDNANLCQASVLDRLNPLLEPNGSLMLHERGLDGDGEVRMCFPHPNFRIFMTMDPNNGELSRPMRNRGIEICLASSQDWSSNLKDLNTISNSILPGIDQRAKDQLIATHNLTNLKPNKGDLDKAGMQLELTPSRARDFTFLCRWVAERIQRGFPFHQALQQSTVTVYREQIEFDLQHLLATQLSTDIFRTPVTNEIGLDSQLSLLLKQLTPFYSMVNNLDANNQLHKLQVLAAGTYFIERVSSQDQQLRSTMLDWISSQNADHLGIFRRLKFLLMKINQYPTFQELNLAFQQLCQFTSTEDYTYGLNARDLVFHSELYTKLQTQVRRSDDIELKLRFERYNQLMHKFKINIQFLNFDFDETNLLQELNSKLNNFNLLQQSILLYNKHQLVENDNLELIRLFYPIIIELKRMVSEYLNQSEASLDINLRFEQVLDYLQSFWDLINRTDLELAKLKNIIKWINKVVSNLPNPQQLLQLTTQLIAFIGKDHHLGMKLLWKYLHYPVASNVELSTRRNKWIEQLTQQDIYYSPMTSVFTFWDRDRNLNHGKLIVEALATYHILDTSSSDYEHVLKSIDTILEQIFTEMEVKFKPFDELDYDNYTSNNFTIPLLTMLDVKNLSFEGSLLSHLIQIPSRANIDHQSTLSFVKQILEFNSVNSSRGPLDFLAYQNIMWILEKPKSDLTRLRGHLIDQSIAWHSRLWQVSFNQLSVKDDDENQVESFNGPAKLFQATNTLALMKLACNVQNLPLENHVKSSNHLKTLTRNLFNTSTTSTSIENSSVKVAIGTLSQIIFSFKKYFDSNLCSELQTTIHVIEDELSLINKVLFKVPTSVRTNLVSFTNLIENTNSLIQLLQIDNIPILTNTIQNYIVPALQQIQPIVENLYKNLDGTSTFYIGKLWVYVGLAYLDTFIPSYPYDPIIKAQMKLTLLDSEKVQLEALIHVYQQILINYNSSTTNPTIVDLQIKLKQVVEKQGKLQGLIVPRPEVSQLLGLFQDIHYLVTNITKPKFVIELVNRLEKEPDSDALFREKVFHANLEEFVKRTAVKYPLYPDIFKPIQLALQQVRFGVRLCAFSSNVATTKYDKPVGNLVQSLLAYTSHFDSEYNGFMNTITDNHSLLKVKALLTRKSKVNDLKVYGRLLEVVAKKFLIDLDTTGYVNEYSYQHFEDIYAEVGQLWNTIEDHKRKQQIENQSLYKRKTQDFENLDIEDSKLLEEESRRLFPQYNEDFDPEHGDHEIKIKSSNIIEVDPEWIREIVLTHQLICNMHFNSRVKSAQISLEMQEKLLFTTFQLSYDLVKRLDKPNSNDLDVRLEQANQLTSYLSLQYLNDAYNSTAITNEITGPVPYNFYHSTNLGETKLAVPVLNKLSDRLEELLQMWPEHAVLLELRHIVSTIKKVSIASPVMKMLTGLEMLLRKAQEWELYASKEVSLNTNLSQITELIIRWRQIELGSWPTLLDSVYNDAKNSAFTWWLQLYNSIIAIDKASDEILDITLNLLDQFLRSSNVGEFLTRMELVHTFHLHLRSKFKQCKPTIIESKLVQLVGNVYDFYQQFLAPVQDHITIFRKPIEKDLKGKVKVASWKDVNVEALKQSAQKTHRHLTKLTRKFKLYLLQPISTLLNEVVNNVVDKPFKFNKKTKSDKQTVDFNSVQSNHNLTQLTCSYDVELDATLNKFKSLYRLEIFNLNRQTYLTPANLQKFNQEVLSQLDELKKDVIPEDKEERKNYIKLRKMIKKKSLSNLFKQLKFMGLRYRSSVRKERPAGFIFHQANLLPLDNVWHQGQLALDSKFGNMYGDSIQLEKAQFYTQRSMARLAHLRNCAKTPNPAISLTETEKGMGYVDSLLQFVFEQRTALHSFQTSYKPLVAITAALVQIKENGGILLNTYPLQKLHRDSFDVNQCIDYLRKTLKLVSIGDKVVLEDSSSYKTALNQVLNELEIIKKDIDGEINRNVVLPSASTFINPIYSQSVVKCIQNTADKVYEAYLKVNELISQSPEKDNQLIPLLHHLDHIIKTNCEEIHPEENELELCQQLETKVQSVIKTIQISAQKLVKRKQSLLLDVPDLDSYDLAANFLPSSNTHFIDSLNWLELIKIQDHLEEISTLLLSVAQRPTTDELQIGLTKILDPLAGFLHQHMLIGRNLMFDFLAYHHGTCKLLYFMINLTITLLTQGLCLPDSEDGEEGDEAGPDQQGTGVGEGEGANDVTEEIENEDQVTGTQNEAKSNHEQRHQDKDKAMEMEEDFEGEMEDVDEKEEKSEDEESEDDEEDDSNEMEDQLGSVDEEGIDDKIWGDEEEPQDSKNPPKEDKNSKAVGEDDVVAKDDEEQPSTKDDQTDLNQEPDNNKDQNDQGEGEEDLEEFEDKLDANQNQTDQIPDGENLELPEDLDLDMSEKEEEDSITDDEDLEGMEDMEDMEDISDKEIDATDPQPELEESQQPTETERPKGETAEEQEEDIENTENPQDLDDEDKPEENKIQVESEDKQLPKPNEPIQEKLENEVETEMTNDQNQPEDSSTLGTSGKQGTLTYQDEGNPQDEANQEDEMDLEKPEQQTEPNSKGKSGKEDPNDKDAKEQEVEEPNEVESDARRSLAEALSKWKRKEDVQATEPDVDQIEQGADEEAQPNPIDDQAEQDFEYVLEDDVTATEHQTLAPANDQQLNDSIPLPNEEQMEHDKEEQDNRTKPIEMANVNEPQLDLDMNMDAQPTHNATQLIPNLDLHASEITNFEFQPDVTSANQSIELSYQDPTSTTQRLDQWSQFEASTHDLALSLCEQLRLILEPTLANKLKGDYNTGKRLNMKKIIPYIASGFKKDKIWLRRTLPNKRSYQILLAIDDSKSMAESNSQKLTFTALATVLKAMTQLEVGTIAVCKFGEQIDLLHPFNSPFTTMNGAHLLQNLTFQQQKTNLIAMLDSSAHMFQEARFNATVKDLWQLQIILSDGITEDHAQLQNRIRKLEELRILTLFVIIDTNESILGLKSINYVMEGGVPKLEMKKYLATFPFKYYLILNDINQLPFVLSDALRQYFGLVI